MLPNSECKIRFIWVSVHIWIACNKMANFLIKQIVLSKNELHPFTSAFFGITDLIKLFTVQFRPRICHNRLPSYNFKFKVYLKIQVLHPRKICKKNI